MFAGALNHPDDFIFPKENHIHNYSSWESWGRVYLSLM